MPPPRASAGLAKADMELHSLEREISEISILETSLSRLGLGELNSIVEVFGPGRICNTAEMLGISSGQAFDLRLADRTTIDRGISASLQRGTRSGGR